MEGLGGGVGGMGFLNSKRKPGYGYSSKSLIFKIQTFKFKPLTITRYKGYEGHASIIRKKQLYGILSFAVCKRAYMLYVGLDLVGHFSEILFSRVICFSQNTYTFYGLCSNGRVLFENL